MSESRDRSLANEGQTRGRGSEVGSSERRWSVKSSLRSRMKLPTVIRRVIVFSSPAESITAILDWGEATSMELKSHY